jgi:hypothetical protein
MAHVNGVEPSIYRNNHPWVSLPSHAPPCLTGARQAPLRFTLPRPASAESNRLPRHLSRSNLASPCLALPQPAARRRAISPRRRNRTAALTSYRCVGILALPCHTKPNLAAPNRALAKPKPAVPDQNQPSHASPRSTLTESNRRAYIVPLRRYPRLALHNRAIRHRA